MKKQTYINLSIAIIVIVALIRLIFAITHTVSGDACLHLSAAHFIANENKLPLFEGLGRLQPFWAPPLFHIITAFFYKIAAFISQDLAIIISKLISPLFGTLTVILLYLISRKFYNEKITLYSMIFINFIPVFLDYSIFSYVDITMAFFSVLAVYLMINNRFFLSSASLGLAILSKYNAVFMYPILIYLAYKLSKKYLYRNLAMVTILPLTISSVWFIRNFILLGNPVWPFLNGIFNGVNIGTSFNTINIGSIFSFAPYLKSYLELFGVPNGAIELISFLDIPFIGILLAMWFIGTLIFIFPFIVGLFQKKNYFIKAIYILFASYLFMLFVYLTNTNWFSPRLLLPVLPFMAIIWAKGLNRIKFNSIYLVIVLLISTGFVAAETIKLQTATKEWNIYNQDFEWATSNSNSKDIFYGNGQCLSYNLNRQVISNQAPLDTNKIDYVFINNKWRVDNKINQDSLNKIESSSKLTEIYSNKDTGTVIYKVTP